MLRRESMPARDSLRSLLGLPTAEALAVAQELLVQDHERVPAVEVSNRSAAFATADSDDPVLHRHTREATSKKRRTAPGLPVLRQNALSLSA